MARVSKGCPHANKELALLNSELRKGSRTFIAFPSLNASNMKREKELSGAEISLLNTCNGALKYVMLGFISMSVLSLGQ